MINLDSTKPSSVNVQLDISDRTVLPVNIDFIDGLRGLAALYVLIHHASYLLQEGELLLRLSGHSTNPMLSPFDAFVIRFMSIFRSGWVAVMLFFVLSGFVIHLRQAQQLSTTTDLKFQWRKYFMRRIKRIYPPLLLAILITFVTDKLGLWMTLSPYTNSTPYSMINRQNPEALSDVQLIGNLLLLTPFGYFVTWGTNLPLWSLGYEWWFYMIYPVLLIMMKRWAWPATILVALFFLCFTIVGSIPSYLARDIFLALPSWWCGVLVAEIYVGRIKLTGKFLAALSLFALTVAYCSRSHWAKGFFESLFFAAMLMLLLYANRKGWRFTPLVRLRWLGRMSYTIYIIHMPILVLLSGILMSNSPDHRLPTSVWPLIVGCLVVLGLAYIGYLAAERPFMTDINKKIK